MAVKLKKGKKQNDFIGQLLQKEMTLLRREMDKKLEESLKNATDDMQAQFSSLAANLASVFVSGNVSARSLANAEARSFVPAIENFLNKSLGQQGDDLLGFLNKAQRNM